jgi:hypothetical protein
VIDDLVAKANGGGYVAQVGLRNHVHRLLDDRAGRETLVEFLRRAGPRAWLTLDSSMRVFGYGDSRSRQPTAMARVRGALQSLAVRRPGVIDVGLASMSRDGRARESAVGKLATDSDALAGPFLALRSVDWVDEVRALATNAVAGRLRSDASLAVASAPLVFALAGRQRQSGLADLVLERAAADAEIRTALLAARDGQTRRRVISHEPVRDALSIEELLALAASDDTAVASTAGVAAISRHGVVDLGDAVERLMAGPALVRRAVLEALPEGERTREIAHNRLFDRSPAVRGAAQKAYARAAGDAATVYRTALSRGEHVPTAILELATVGGEQDHAIMLGALRSPESATRRAAVSATKWIAPGRLPELLIPMLWDTAPGVTRAAERTLQAQAQALDGKVLGELAETPGSHNRRAAYRLLRRRTAAERVEADLIGLADPDAANQRDALGDLLSWLWKGAASAPRADLATRRRLSSRLDRVEREVGSQVAERVRFHAALRPADLGG